MKAVRLRQAASAVFVFCVLLIAQGQPGTWKPDTDWAHWRLGHHADLDFLRTNRLTVTFGGGAPNFETVTRRQFEQEMEKAKTTNRALHDQGYIVLRYLTSSLAGHTATSKDAPRKDQLELLRFWRESWNEFADYLGPRPAEDPTTWITVRPDGSFPHYRYAPYGQQTGGGFETWGCPNNPDFVRLMEGRVRAQAQAGIDGSYIDWTQIAGETCYCGYCKRAFSAYLKENLPPEAARAKYGTADYDHIAPPHKRGQPFWMEWISFRGHSVAEFHKRLRTAARQYNPHFMIAGNVFGGFGYGPIAYDAAGNMEMLGRDGYDDFIYSEVQEYLESAPRKDDRGTKITNSAAFKFLNAAVHDRPYIVYATEITPPIFPHPSERCLSAMAQINIAEAAANRAVFREKRETPPGATEIYRFLAANESALRNTRMYSSVAVVASLRQYLADELSFAFSASRVLADRGVAHVMVTEDDLRLADLNRFQAVIVPYLPLLSAGHQQALASYAQGGGRLLILGASGVKDEYGVPRKDVALARLLGASRYPGRDVSLRVGKGRVDYVALAVPPSRFLVPPRKGGESTTFGPAMGDVFPDIPEAYTRNRMDPQVRLLLNKIADKAANTVPTTRRTSAHPYVELTTMLETSGRRLLLHAVNYDVTLDGAITPARNLEVQVALPPGKSVQRVTWSGTLSGMEPAQYRLTQAGDSQIVHLQLATLDIYGLANIELQ